MRLSIVIPAYNEEKRLPKALDPMLRYLRRGKLSYEIIVVVDKSRDRTLEVVRDYSKRDKRIRHIFNPRKSGKGYAVRKGMLASKGDLVLMADADTSTPIMELDGFLESIEQYDIVIGSREHKESDVKKKLISRVILGNIGNMLLRLFIIKDIRDTQCGFKLFRGEVARRLFRMSRIDGFGFDFEIIFLAQKYGYKILEAPVRWTFCEGTKVTWGSHFTTLGELLRIVLNNLAGRYPSKKETRRL